MDKLVQMPKGLTDYIMCHGWNDDARYTAHYWHPIIGDTVKTVGHFTPGDGGGSLWEIRPYATFSIYGGAGHLNIDFPGSSLMQAELLYTEQCIF